MNNLAKTAEKRERLGNTVSKLGRILTSCCGGLSAAAAAAKMAEMGWPVLSIT